MQVDKHHTRLKHKTTARGWSTSNKVKHTKLQLQVDKHQTGLKHKITDTG